MRNCSSTQLGTWIPLPGNILEIIHGYVIPYECVHCSDHAIGNMGFTRAENVNAVKGRRRGMKGMPGMKGHILYSGIKTYCRELLMHNRAFTYKDFAKVYIGHWYDLSKCAKSVMGYTSDSCKFAEYNSVILRCVDWGRLWNKIKGDYYEMNGHVFRSANSRYCHVEFTNINKWITSLSPFE